MSVLRRVWDLDDGELVQEKPNGPWHRVLHIGMPMDRDGVTKRHVLFDDIEYFWADADRVVLVREKEEAA